MKASPYSLENKRILITGASSGLGRAAAKAISEAGGKLIISGRNQQRLQETFDNLTGDGHQMIEADFLGENPVKDICSGIESPVDGIVHSAGIAMTRPFKFCTEEQVRKIMRVNFDIPYMLTQQLFKNKLLANGSSVVFLSSIGGGVMGRPGLSIYGASKAAINGALLPLAIELAAKKIRINSLMPGSVNTEIVDGSANVSTEDFRLDELKYPLGYGEPEDIAATIIYFLSDAAKWITGTTFVIDGGASIH